MKSYASCEHIFGKIPIEIESYLDKELNNHHQEHPEIGVWFPQLFSVMKVKAMAIKIFYCVKCFPFFKKK